MKSHTKMKEQMINDVLSDFDFEKVHRVMKEIGWRWFFEDDEHVPSIYMLIKQATQLLSEAFDNESRVSTGGFTADYRGGVLSLIFVLEEQMVTKEEYD